MDTFGPNPLLTTCVCIAVEIKKMSEYVFLVTVYVQTVSPQYCRIERPVCVHQFRIHPCMFRVVHLGECAVWICQPPVKD